MKRLTSFLVALFLATTALWAYDFKSGDLCYNITSDSTVTLTCQECESENNYSDLVIADIPDTVFYNSKRYTVTGVGMNSQSPFYKCKRLIAVYIPRTVVHIENGSLACWNDLAVIKVDSQNPKYDSRDNCNAVIETKSNSLICGCKNTIIPKSVVKIECFAFSGCNALTSIDISSNVKTIGFQSFAGTSLTSVRIPDGVDSIGHWAFILCSKLESISISSTVKLIKDDFVQRCDNLRSIIVAANNEVYDSRSNCNAIIDTKEARLVVGCPMTTIPNSVQTIGYSAFRGQTNLTSITIPNGVTTIEGGAFDITSVGGMVGLTSVVLPQSISKIGVRAFSGCSNLTSITCLAIEPPYCDYDETWGGAFTKLDIASIPLYVPAGSIERYRTATQWKDFDVQAILDTPTNTNTVYLTNEITHGKVFRNGQVYILRGGKTYTLIGEEVE